MAVGIDTPLVRHRQRLPVPVETAITSPSTPALSLAAHRTPVRRLGMAAATVETVRFSRPETVDFRLVRGPVPHVVERFTLHDDDGRTRLEYDGELGTDFWAAGRWWGALVARKWEATVQSSLDRIGVEAERRSARTR